MSSLMSASSTSDETCTFHVLKVDSKIMNRKWDFTEKRFCMLLLYAAEEKKSLSTFCGRTGRGRSSAGRGKRFKCESVLTCP